MDVESRVLEALHTGKVNYWAGSVGRDFERTFARRLGFRYAVSVLNGAAARRVAYFALDRDPPTRGDIALFPACHRVGGKVAYFAFGPGSPIVAGGQGGMVCTNDEALAWEMRSIRDHGYDARAKLEARHAALSAKNYIHRRLGYNYRLTEIQSILGLHELMIYYRKKGTKRS